MKQCPKCNIEYSDTTLEFCLEDGTRLVSISARNTEVPTVISSKETDPTTEKTMSLPFSAKMQTFDFGGVNSVDQARQKTLVKDKVVERSNTVLELAPFVIALAHNWWQWIYLNNQYYSSFSNYVLSANFLMWALLLTTGAVFGLLAVRRCRNKGFAYASLVILSINLILFLVPKR